MHKLNLLLDLPSMAVICAGIVTVFFALIVDKHAAHVVDLNCNFDIDLCNWQQDKNDDFDWSFKDGGAPTLTGGQHIFLELENKLIGKQATLVSAVQTEGNYCLSFWYNIYGWKANIKIKRTSGSRDETVLFEKTSYGYDSKWVFTQDSIEVNEEFQIGVVGEVGYSNSVGHIYFDDIRLSSGFCKSDCDFDSDWCGWTKDNSWYRIKRVSSYLSDHTSGAGYFVRSQYYHQYSNTIVSPVVVGGVYCLSFWYRLVDYSVYHLNVYVREDGSEQETLIKHQPVSYTNFQQWKLVGVSITASFSYRIVIKPAFKWSGNLDMDDFQLCQGVCGNGSVNIDCTFESGRCSWLSENSGDWIVADGKSWTYLTAPASDHTTLSKDGHYIYVSGTKARKAVLTSPRQKSGVYCLSWWYYMNGDASRKQQLMVYKNDLPQAVFSKVGNQGEEWRHAQIEINSTENFVLKIIADRRDSYGGGIAVDDVNMCPGPCMTDSTSTYWYQPRASSFGELSDLFKAGVIVNDTAAIIFEVKSRSDVRMLLYENGNTTIQVVIGAHNNTSLIRIIDETEKTVYYSENKIVTASAYRAFWISWDDNAVRVGKGFIPSMKTFLTLNESHYNIKSLTVEGSIYSDVYWRFYKDKFPRTTMMTSSNVQTTLSPQLSQTKDRLTSTSLSVSETWTTPNVHTTPELTTRFLTNITLNNNRYITGSIQSDDEKLVNNNLDSGNDSVAITAVVVSSVVAIIITVATFMVCIKRGNCSRVSQCWNRRIGHATVATVTENKTYAMPSVRFENVSDVKDRSENSSDNEYINLRFEVRATDTEYNNTEMNSQLKEEQHNYGRLGAHQPDTADSVYSHFQIQTIIQQEEDPMYDHASLRKAEGNPNSGDEYTHLNKVSKPSLKKDSFENGALENK